MKPIYILGFMGSGKSFQGAALADLLAFDFIDLDKYIEEQEQSSITDIFLNIGESNFRVKETYYLKNILVKENLIISLGGGTPCFNNNMQYIKETGVSIYLKEGAELLYKRLKPVKNERPLLMNVPDDELLQFIKQKLMEREPYYLQADIIVDEENINSIYLKKLIYST